jgi:DNA-directed RNA polymerase specialized sigma24 family protein
MVKSMQETPPVKEKKRRIRRKADDGKKSSEKSDKMYFNNETQDAIVEYQQCQDKREREKLYVIKIMPAFEKLAENLINIHKFTGLHDSYEDLKSDCMNFLFETIKKFDASRGTNAFSYFNVVAKNWLINRTKQKNARSRKNVSIDDPIQLTVNEHKIIDDYYTLPAQDVVLERLETAADIVEVLYEVRNIVRTENELACVNSIITIFENMENVDLVNKTAILLYMRELSGLSPKQLTTSMQAIKKYYRRFRNNDDLGGL